MRPRKEHPETPKDRRVQLSEETLQKLAARLPDSLRTLAQETEYVVRRGLEAIENEEKERRRG